MLVDVPEPWPQAGARHVQQHAARRRSHHRGGLRQRLSHALGLHGGLDRLAAGRAAPGRPHGAGLAARARRGGARHRPAPLPVAAERPGGHPAAGGPVSHPVSRRLARRRRGGADGARARGRAAPAGAARGMAVRPPGSRRARVAGCLASASPGRLRAGRDLRAHLPLPGSDAGGPRSARGARRGRLAALRRRGGGKSQRGPARPRLCLRRLADGTLPPPLPLSGAQRGRERAPGLRRGVPARGGRPAGRVQHALRPALAQRDPERGQPLPVHRRRAVGSADRAARRAAVASGRRAARCRRSSP